MLAHKLTLADGTVLGANAIRSVTLTEQVSDQEELMSAAEYKAYRQV